MMFLPTDRLTALAVHAVADIEVSFVDDLGLALLPEQREALMDQYVGGYLDAHSQRR